MAFWEHIIAWDKELLLFGNSFHTPFLDNVFLIFSGKLIWLPAVLVLIYTIVRTQRRDAVWTILFLALAIVLADQISSGLLKPLVARLRPTHEPTLAGLVQIVHGYKGGLYGFASSHAANATAVAVFTALLFRRKLYTWTISLWAVTNMYTRIYLGVHYPADIFCGILIGALAALSMFYLMKRFVPKTLSHSDDSHLDNCIYLFVGVVVVSIFAMMALNFYWEFLS